MAIIVSDTGPGPRRAGGGKLSRSETVTVRLDPKLNYLCELAARAQRRTKSSFIEWAIEAALEHIDIPGEKKTSVDLYTLADRNMELWDVEEPDRIIALAQYAPALLNHDEQRLWKVITTSGYLWRGQYGVDGEWLYNPDDRWKLIIPRVREMWAAISAVASGEEPREKHPNLMNMKRPDKAPAFGDDLSDDLPF